MNAAASRIPRKAALMLAAVFVVGFLLGGLAVWLYSGAHVLGARPHGHIRYELTRELQLSSQQRQQLDAIFADADQRWRALDEQIQRQRQQLRQETRSRIRSMLTTEQQQKFDAFLKRLDEERRARQRH